MKLRAPVRFKGAAATALSHTGDQSNMQMHCLLHADHLLSHVQVHHVGLEQYSFPGSHLDARTHQCAGPFEHYHIWNIADCQAGVGALHTEHKNLPKEREWRERGAGFYQEAQRVRVCWDFAAGGTRACDFVIRL